MREKMPLVCSDDYGKDPESAKMLLQKHLTLMESINAYEDDILKLSQQSGQPGPLSLVEVRGSPLQEVLQMGGHTFARAPGGTSVAIVARRVVLVAPDGTYHRIGPQCPLVGFDYLVLLHG